MKISTFIWLKSFGGQTGTVYSSRIYAVEVDEGFGYEADVRSIDRDRSAGYVDSSEVEHLNSWSQIVSATKHKNPVAVVDDATGVSYELLGITKHRNPLAGFDDDLRHSSTVVGITKKLGGYYLSKRLPDHEMEAASVVAAIAKIRRALAADPVHDEMYGLVTAKDIIKVRKVLLGSALDGLDVGSQVQSIIKTTRYIDGSVLTESDILNVVSAIEKHRNPTSQTVHGLDTTSIVDAIIKKNGAGFVSRRTDDGIIYGSEAIGVTKVHPFVYGQQLVAMDAGSMVVAIGKARKVVETQYLHAFTASSAVQNIRKNSHVIEVQEQDGFDVASIVSSIEKKRSTTVVLEAPQDLRLENAPMFRPTFLMASIDGLKRPMWLKITVSE